MILKGYSVYVKNLGQEKRPWDRELKIASYKQFALCTMSRNSLNKLILCQMKAMFRRKKPKILINLNQVFYGSG